MNQPRFSRYRYELTWVPTKGPHRGLRHYDFWITNARWLRTEIKSLRQKGADGIDWRRYMKEPKP